MRSLGKVGAHVEIRQASANSQGEESLVTELNVMLGEWHTLGVVKHQNRGRSGELFGSSSSSDESRHDIRE